MLLDERHETVLRNNNSNETALQILLPVIEEEIESVAREGEEDVVNLLRIPHHHPCLLHLRTTRIADAAIDVVTETAATVVTTMAIVAVMIIDKMKMVVADVIEMTTMTIMNDVDVVVESEAAVMIAIGDVLVAVDLHPTAVTVVKNVIVWDLYVSIFVFELTFIAVEQLLLKLASQFVGTCRLYHPQASCRA